MKEQILKRIFQANSNLSKEEAIEVAKALNEYSGTSVEITSDKNIAAACKVDKHAFAKKAGKAVTDLMNVKDLTSEDWGNPIITLFEEMTDQERLFCTAVYVSDQADAHREKYESIINKLNILRGLLGDPEDLDD